MIDTPTPAYMLVQRKVKNHVKYMQRFGKFVVAICEKIGSQVVAVLPAPTGLEGTYDGNWTVVIRCPSMMGVEAWCNSPGCQPLKDLRINELTEGGAAVC